MAASTGRVKRKRTTKRRVVRRSRVRGTSEGSTRTFNGQRFTRKMCGTKPEMNKRKEAVKAKGGKARVVKSPGKGYCLYTRSK